MKNLIKKFVIPFSGVALLVASPVSAELYDLQLNAEVIVPSPEETRIQHLSWPKITRTKSGVLVLAYSAGIGHNQGGSGLAVSISKDEGQSFSPPKVLTYFPDDDDRYDDMGNLAMGTSEDGKSVLILAMGFNKERGNTVLGWRSSDDGETWDRIDTNNLAENKTGSVFGHVFPVPGKGLAVCGHYRNPKGNGIWIAYSEDEGASWGSPHTISEERFFEPVFIFSQDRLIGLVRENDAHAYHQFVSDDLGESWEFTRTAIQGNAKAVHPSPFLVSDPRNPDVLYALISEREPSHQITLWKSKPNPLEWKPVCKVTEGGGDWTYPWMTHLGGNEWYLVYYQGDKKASSIYGRRVSIPEN
tara:strand:+ start:411 stop:1484 length:1074 start_codon:yes stop_codon:yes gene_type:complete